MSKAARVERGDIIKVTIGFANPGTGAVLARKGRTKRGDETYEFTDQISGSIMDMAELLFDLKEALSAHPLGRGCVDRVAARRAEIKRTKVRT